MIKLIYNELYKTFHKKSIYILWMCIFIFCLINNILFKITYDNNGYYIDDKKDNIEEKIKELEIKIKNEQDIEYVRDKTNLDILKLQSNYKKDTFQYNKTKDYFYNTIYSINYYTEIEENTSLLEEYKNTYNKYLNWFNNNNNNDFIKENVKEIDKKLETDKNNQELLLQKEILLLRLNKNIDYSTNYLNDAINNYYNSSLELNNFTIQKDYQDKIKYNELIKEKYLNKYIIDNKLNINKNNDLRGSLKTILEDYEIFIILIIIVITSTIISEEYNKGTIKLLLAKPYSRNKIILSKYLTSIIILFISIILLILLELWIGGVIFGLSSLKIPIVVYDFNINNIKEYNIFIYMLIRILYNLPKLLFILTLCFLISIISLNSVISSITTLTIYLFTDPIINLFKKYSLTKLTILPNYNFLIYINGNINKYLNIKINYSITIYIFHYLLLFLLIFVIFKKRDIKNI